MVPYIPNKLIQLSDISSREKLVSGLRLNHFLYIKDCKDAVVVLQMNQKVARIVIENCTNCDIQIRDSVVITSRTIDVINTKNSRFLIDEVDVRTFNCYHVEDNTLQFTAESTLMENCIFGFDETCKNNVIELANIKPNSNPNSSFKMVAVVSSSTRVEGDGTIRSGQYVDGLHFEIISNAMSYEVERVREAIEVATEGGKLVDEMKSDQLEKFYDHDLKEYTDEPSDFMRKVKHIAEHIRENKHVVVYTGAGISTSASIPDYRGPNGVWTLLKKGQQSKSMELSQASPTYAHYALTELVRRNLVKYIVSTNLDGLHRRSGTKANEMSELHGNCYKEVCATCKQEYLRGYDTLTSRLDRWSHLTGRHCKSPCRGPLKDTIVHFTENVPLDQMDPAIYHARKADVALVLGDPFGERVRLTHSGTSMNVQPAASLPEKSLRNVDGKLYIVNLQKTPFDDVANAVVHEKTDKFMEALMHELGISDFDRSYDHTLLLLQKEVEEEQRERRKWIAAASVGVAIIAVICMSWGVKSDGRVNKQLNLLFNNNGHLGIRLQLLSVLLVIISLTSVVIGQGYPDQNVIQALTDFYDSTGGPQWKVNTGWVPPKDYCGSTYGITCDSSKNIQTISLSTNNLEGTIPSSISKAAPNLVSLILKENKIHGSIPDSICDWAPTLQTFWIGANMLNGTLPTCVSQLVNLLSVNVSNNQLTGSVPSLSGLTKIQFFSIYDNSFTGSIPDLPMTNTLHNLDLSYNMLTGHIPANISQLTGIKELWLQYNNFDEGPVPDFSQMTLLEKLSLPFSRLNGEMPNYFGNMKNLQVLSLGNNDINGSFPDSLCRCPLLYSLNLANNDLTGTVPTCFTTMPALWSVNLQNNFLTGPVPIPTSLPSLRQLDLSGNSFTGQMVTGEWRNSGLVYLNLANNQLTGGISADLFSQGNISRIELQGNMLTGALPRIDSMSLDYVDLSDNQFTSINQALILRQATTLYLQRNNFTGFLPLSLYTSRMLRVLDLSYNNFYGPISKTLYALSTLEELYLNDNQLSGSIPAGISRLASLTRLSLANNQLTASSLDEYTMITDLQYMNLSYNQISAQMTGTIGNMVELQVNYIPSTTLTSQIVDISHNQLFGSIPLEVYMMRGLRQIYMNDNRLTGSIGVPPGTPGVPPGKSDPDILDVSNNMLTGQLWFVSRLSSIQYLNISHNQFYGVVEPMSGALNLQVLDISYNQLTGQLPSYGGLTRLEYFDASYNQLSGYVPSFQKDTLLSELYLQGNNISDSSMLASTNLTLCNMKTLPLTCPISKASYDLCAARCTPALNTDTSSSSVQFKLFANCKDFDQREFQNNISRIVNITADRIKIDAVYGDTLAGGCVVNVEVNGGQKDSVSSKRVTSVLKQMYNGDTSYYNASSLRIYEMNVPIPGSQESLSTKSVIGIAVACVLVFILLVVALVFLFIIWRRNRRLKKDHDLMSQLDISNINFGNASKSIINFSDLQSMRMIGSGAFGIVYRATWRGSTVAVKQIRAECVQVEQLQDFLNEVSIVQQLRPHPNVVLFMAATFPPDPLSIVSEYCEGGSLYDHLRNNSASVYDKAKFIKGIALGMLHLHSEGVIHRDLAARNILLTKHLEPKVCDFGMSRQAPISNGSGRTSSARITNSNVGPLKWMAPEAIKNREYSIKSDVFSFGVVIWEIITVSDPWPSLSAMEAAFAVVVEGRRLHIPSGTDVKWSQIMKSCWHFEPELRPTFEILTDVLHMEGQRDVGPLLTSNNINQPAIYHEATAFELRRKNHNNDYSSMF
ncbi:putative LRR receptor-like serine/threonine-protein kinase [Planoprotostelium fungivorum]|uniref:protein acetyllysine N-acetyltransferase n=1 Tax=Planoprotostelium fungivorum TaxID=1890364 RepID=A0A2P6NS13_9EUKA|nr:putative LRR receptor-like serine/threonine-protein kinase [Planoprotostelium fungivorum]